MAALLVLTLLAADRLSDPVAIVQRLATSDQRNLEVARQYTFLRRSEERELDGAGSTKKIESKTRDVTFLYGRPYARLVARNDKPLAAAERSKEDEKFNKEAEKRRRESAAERQDQAQRDRRDWEELRKLIGEIPKAYHLKLEGMEKIDGREVYRVSALPRGDYRRFLPPYSLLTKLRGMLWIDAEEYQVVKVETEVIETASFGLILARASPGTRLLFEQTRVNGEVWLPRRAELKLDGRLGFFKKVRAEASSTWSDFRKFQTESRVVETATVP